jgi:uncharacterized tellurite resistance protein B-like protein
MIEKLRKFLQGARENSGEAADEAGEWSARVAVAALLVEMARADFNEAPEERQAIRRLLERHFSIEKAQAEELLGLGGKKADEAVSLQKFTREIHEAFDPARKLHVLEMLIRTALADGEIDMHERHLLGKIADLIYVPRADYVTLMDRILAETGN